MRAQGTNGARPPGLSNRELWRRSRETEASRDEGEYLMDLAAFAEGRLDPDETDRVAALLAQDIEATADVAAARTLAGMAVAAADAAVISRAAALAGEGQSEALLIAFPTPRRPALRPWYNAAGWSGLAAAMVVAGWLGFDLGSGLSSSSAFGRPGEDISANELLDAAPLVVRDFTESSRI
jgi:anti-sigma factor RsiW